MKLSILFLSFFLSTAALAAESEIRLDGQDAQDLQDIFLDAGKTFSSVMNPMFSTATMSLEFDNPKLSVHCRTHSVSGANTTCLVRGEEGIIELSDPAIVTKIYHRLGNRVYVSESKAQDQRSPKVTLSCTANGPCRLSLMN